MAVGAARAAEGFALELLLGKLEARAAQAPSVACDVLRSASELKPANFTDGDVGLAPDPNAAAVAVGRSHGPESDGSAPVECADSDCWQFRHS